jgi:hypothetical protein
MGSVPGERSIDQPDLPAQGVVSLLCADTETVDDGPVKVGRYRHFEVFSDEPPRSGGTDLHPQPLTYICMGIGF